jgi:aspartyl-tRNA(Asn)/glutamyl-tRNA(Gln) amidotransferase subunit A
MTAVYEVVRATIEPHLERALAASRARPFPASPSSPAPEPADSARLFHRLLADQQVDEGVADAPDAVHPPVGAARPEPFDPVTAGVGGLLEAYASGRATPSEVFAALAPRWSDRGAVWSDAVLRAVGFDEQVADADARWASGTARPLEGIPFAVKDIIDVGGEVVTSGSLQTGDRVAPTDATVVARLRAAGAIPVFMAATTEFACGAPSSRRYGAVRNPWDPARWTGGSSTGSGSALAARIVPLALGTDTGGSIRVPSALCGVTGIKPTYGLVPRTGVSTLSWTLDHVGPMARDARDLARALTVMAGADDEDPSAPAGRVVIDADADAVRGMRIGIAGGWFAERVDRSVLDAFEAAVATFAALGAQMVPIEFDGVEQADSEGWTVFYGELASTQEGNADTAHLFDDGTRARFEVSLLPTAADYLRALRRRPLVQAAFLRRMDAAGIDVLLTPGVGATAPRLDDLTMSVDGVPYNLHDVIPRNTRIFDYTGFPALMMPAGIAPDGLPVGVQLVARPWQDRLCLAAAAAFQDATDFHRRMPTASATRGPAHL